MGNFEQKQRINLSGLALSVLDSDCVLFGAASRAGFYNRVIASFCDTAKASIDVACERYAEELETALPRKGNEAIHDALTAHYRRRLRSEIDAYPQGESVLFRLNNENYQRLYDEFDEQRAEADNYSSVSKYLKALLEEYARLAPAERERIYFADVLEQTVQPAIDAGYALEITLGPNRFLVTPYAVLSDVYGAHLYLAGISRPMNDPDAPPTIASFRVSRLGKPRYRKTAKHRRLTADDKRDIEKKLREVGVQYLLGDREETRLRLTPRGMQFYMQRSYMRPYADKIGEDGVCTFSCTLRQIENYFLPFGCDVEILEPAHLRARFLEAYQAAAAVYEP